MNYFSSNRESCRVNSCMICSTKDNYMYDLFVLELGQVARHDVLPDWEGLRPYVRFPCYLKYLPWRSSSFLHQKVATFLLVEQLELACYISAAFLRAHRMTRHHIREFIGSLPPTFPILLFCPISKQHMRDCPNQVFIYSSLSCAAYILFRTLYLRRLHCNWAFSSSVEFKLLD